MLIPSLIPRCLLLLSLSVSSWADEAAIRVDSVDPYVELHSELLVGDKGELTFDVSVDGAGRQCGEVWAYDHAELEVLSSRFGAAQFVALPDPGCVQCQPGKVRWYHEPTGYLSFQVRVFRRLHAIPCDDDTASSSSRSTELNNHQEGANRAPLF